MLRITRVLWIAFFAVSFLAFIASALSAFIPTGRFFPSNILSIAFPYLFAILLVLAIMHAFFFKGGWVFILAVLLISSYNLSHIFAVGNKEKFSLQKDSSTLRLLTWNIHGLVVSNPAHAARLADYAQTLEAYRPDVVCLQEHLLVEDFVALMRRQGYPYYARTKDDVAMFSRLPLTNTGLTPFNDEGLTREMLSADIVLNGKNIRLHTFHLLSYQIDKNKEAFVDEYNLKYTLRRLLYVARNQDRQLQAYKAVMDAEPQPHIVCGDFNNVPAGYIYHVARQGMQDTYLKGGCGLGITFPNFLRTLRIDYILADKRFKVRQSAVIKTNASDHYPVVTDVSL